MGPNATLPPHSQASKEDAKQPSIADVLPPLDVHAAALDVCVVGCGPAGLALAAELGALDVNVGLIGALTRHKHIVITHDMDGYASYCQDRDCVGVHKRVCASAAAACFAWRSRPLRGLKCTMTDVNAPNIMQDMLGRHALIAFENVLRKHAPAAT